MNINDITNLSVFLATKKGYSLEDEKEFRIVYDTLMNYSMPTDNYLNNLKSLVISKSNISSESVLGSYDAKRNVINKPSLSSDFVHELFHMASNINDGSPNVGVYLKKGSHGFGKSLNEGITDFFTGLTDNKYEYRYPFESLIASSFCELFGKDIFKYHFDGKFKEFYNQFGEYSDLVIQVVSNLDNYFKELDNLSLGKGINISNLYDSFIDTSISFLELVNNIDENKGIVYFNRIKDMFNLENNNVKSIKALLGSEYGLDSMFSEIKNISFGKSF